MLDNNGKQYIQETINKSITGAIDSFANKYLVPAFEGISL